MYIKNKKLPIKPFLKWAGGKRWLLPKLKLDSIEGTYREPFLGGGAFFFHYSDIIDKAILSDTNADLINCFCQVRDNLEQLLYYLDQLKVNQETYYELRSSTILDPTMQAAAFIYMNKTCYNGLYRVNAKGVFNVPYGHPSADIEVYNKKNIESAREALNKAVLIVSDFHRNMNLDIDKSFYFIDPPYTVAHNNNGFIGYNQRIFSWSDQERLSQFATKINKTGSKLILTNAAHNSVIKLYKDDFYIQTVERHSNVGASIDRRGLYTEVVISNFKLEIV